MALEYKLQLTANAGSQDIARILSARPGFNTADVPWRGPEVLVSTAPASALAQSIIEERFGFIPTVTIVFRLIDSEARENGVLACIGAVMAVLGNFNGNAVLLFNGEDVVLQRIAGTLALNSGWDFWKPNRLSQVSVPYEMKPIRSM